MSYRKAGRPVRPVASGVRPESCSLPLAKRRVWKMRASIAEICDRAIPPARRYAVSKDRGNGPVHSDGEVVVFPSGYFGAGL